MTHECMVPTSEKCVVGTLVPSGLRCPCNCHNSGTRVPSRPNPPVLPTRELELVLA